MNTSPEGEPARLLARDALSAHILQVAAEARPAEVVRERQSRCTKHFAVFDQDRFINLVNPQDALRSSPQRIFADLLPRQAPPPVPPDTPVADLVRVMEQFQTDALPIVGSDGGLLGVATKESLLQALLDHQQRLNAVIAADREQVAQSLARLEQASAANKELLGLLGVSVMELSVLQKGLELTRQLVQAKYGAMHILDEHGQTTAFLHVGLSEEEAQRMAGMPLPRGEGVLGRLQAGEILRLDELAQDPRHRGFGSPAHPTMKSFLGAPIANQGVYGRLYLTDKKDGQPFTTEDELLTLGFAHSIAMAAESARLFEETRRRAEELEALAHVSSALRQAQTREAMLPILVEKTMEALRADSGALLLFENEMLVFSAARGSAEALLGQRHPPGDDPLWQAARTGQPLFIPDVTEESEFTRWEICRALMSGLKACACVPLKAAEATIGLLHLACQSRRAATEHEIRMLASIAEMAGSALHRARLHEQTVQDAVELSQAYESTLEGWARALELRDRETEGHTQRVTEMTLQLARAMGMGEEELVHVRRGALLHDMGKMGIPDSILLKPDKLTPQEWEVMRRHPEYAHAMLSPIAYLHPALDIPYCHHEKWDGSGYPRGLKGEQIPLPARLFAVVDVWDALRSDRPYRQGWPEKKVHEYIRAQAGAHFDPKAVALFFHVMSAQSI